MSLPAVEFMSQLSVLLRRRRRRSRRGLQTATTAAEPLECRIFPAAVLPTAYDQLMLELINLARSDPKDYADSVGIDLNEGLPANTISDSAKQPLAFNLELNDAAHTHSQWMMAGNPIGHTGAGGSNPGTRMSAAGYDFSGTWGWGENIAWNASSGGLDFEVYTTLQHEALFVDHNYPGRGHRTSMLNDDFDEIGVGMEAGTRNGLNTVLTTTDFAYENGNNFLTGVVYDDGAVSDDDFYTIGEQLGGVTITATNQSNNNQYTTTTWASGGYTLQIPNGTYSVTASGGALNDTVTRAGVVVASRNVKVDFLQEESGNDPTKGAITGTVYDDENGNGTQNNGESGLSGWTVFLDANNNNTYDGGEISTTSNGSGGYSFGSLTPGQYRVVQVVQSNYAQTAPGTVHHTATVTANVTTSGVDFGNQQTARSWPLSASSPVQYTDATGNVVTISIKGSGNGTVLLPPGTTGDAQAITITGTNTSTTIKINGTTRIEDIDITGSVKTFDAKSATIAGVAIVRGSITKGKVGAIGNGAAFRVTGSLGKTNIYSNVQGTISAASIPGLTVSGSLINAVILAGANLGEDGRVGGGGANADSFAAGFINKLTVKGSITSSVVGAGLNPVDGIFDNGNDAIVGTTGSVISKMAIKGSVSNDSWFAAFSYPSTVKFGKTKLDPENDPRFL